MEIPERQREIEELLHAAAARSQETWPAFLGDANPVATQSCAKKSKSA